MLDTVFLQIAKSTILDQFDDKETIDKEKLLKSYPSLSKNGAAFVTLNYKHNLRGCIGSIVAYRNLLEDVINNAKSAAFSDPRFHPLSKGEFDGLTLEVSVLSEPKVLEYSDFDDLVQKVRPNIDGLILKHNSSQGTFLPQVWEQLPNPKDFLEHLSMKAGSNKSIYDENPTIYTYQVDSVEDSFYAILPL